MAGTNTHTRDFFVSRFGTVKNISSINYLNNINSRLAQVPFSDPSINQRFKDLNVIILRTGDPIALSLQNNEVLLSLGILDLLQNEPELAFLISHELAHVILNHHTQNKKRAGDAIPLELEADLFALQVIKAAGYPASASISALINTYGTEKFVAPEIEYSKINHENFEHPSLKKRLYNLRIHIDSSEFHKEQNDMIISNRDFIAFKRSLL